MIVKLLNKLNLRFFKINLFFTCIFALLYYLQDIFISRNIDFAERWGLLDKNRNKHTYSDEPSPLYYYFWFSLMTQTTVGYGGADNTVTGKSVTYLDEPNRVAKVINALQLLSILFAVSIA